MAELTQVASKQLDSEVEASLFDQICHYFPIFPSYQMDHFSIHFVKVAEALPLEPHQKQQMIHLAFINFDSVAVARPLEVH